MPDISKISLPSGTTYNIKDEGARELISELMNFRTYLGVTTTVLTDGATTNPITILGQSVTAQAGDVATYDSDEFIWNGSAWQKFGDLSGLGALAYKDSATGTFTPTGTVTQPTFTGSSSAVTITSSASASGNYQPAGTVSQPTFSGSALTSTGSYTPAGGVSLSNTNQSTTVSKASSGTATYTPEGSVSAPTITVTPSTGTVNSITAVGTLPSLTTTVANETLTIGWSAGTLPTKGSNQTVVTGISSATATQPSFTGTGARLVTGNISVPSSATFSGTQATISVSGTPAGTVSQPTFTGTKVQLAGSTTAAGSVSQPTFSGSSGTVTVS